MRRPIAALSLLAPLLMLLASAANNNAEDPEPQRPYHDRHEEMKEPALRILPPQPQLPGMYPTPLHLRERQSFYIRIDNRVDGPISVFDVDGTRHEVGKVLAPVAQTNPEGFTASGWGEPGRITATSVNAIHIKTDHDYATGRGTIFSLSPVEFVDFNPVNYKSYFNKSTSLFTNIKAGTEIFGGRWAPLVNSRIYVRSGGAPAPPAQTVGGQREPQGGSPTVVPDGLSWGGEFDHLGLHDPDMRPLSPPDGGAPVPPMAAGYVPAVGDVLYIKVDRLKYNPEWIEFENRFGGIIWIKELGLDAYPIGQVLKPVVGCGRFLGTQYAGVGRIRANHPGVIDISTSPEGVIGGFQIIPRDHAMSNEMINARGKTQWMVIGPLWALDPSWEGLPPLFTDYLYPEFTPTDSELVSGAAVFLSRFTVRGRYSDDPDPTKYVPMHEASGLNGLALKTLTHIRIYFPRDSKL